MKTTLTDRAVARLVPPKQGRLEVLDAKMPGLALRVTPRGHKSWTVTWHPGAAGTKARDWRVPGPDPGDGA
jgi:hypothetical protein